MRGKDISALSGELISGITPAYAGKSSAVHVILLYLKDHPCVCGEKFLFFP